MSIITFGSKLVGLYSPTIYWKWFVHNYGIIKFNYYLVVISTNDKSLLGVTAGKFFSSVGFLNEQKLSNLVSAFSKIYRIAGLGKQTCMDISWIDSV